MWLQGILTKISESKKEKNGSSIIPCTKYESTKNKDREREQKKEENVNELALPPSPMIANECFFIVNRPPTAPWGVRGRKMELWNKREHKSILFA